MVGEFGFRAVEDIMKKVGEDGEDDGHKNGVSVTHQISELAHVRKG